MTPWLTLVIGVILGLLLGWLIDLLWRRRPEAERVDWPELSDRVAQVADEVVEKPAHIAAVLPETTDGLPAAAIDALAPAPAEREGGPAGDNLQRIEGIGPVYDGRLRAAGITTFAELVDTSEARLQEIIHPQTWQRIDFGEWIEQARLIVEGNEAE